MKLFKRRQKSISPSGVPAEIQAYSQAEHREKMGIALLVGFISIILTLVVLFGLFLGGRWMYRKIAGTGEKQSTTTAVEKKDTTSKEDGANNGSAEPTSGDSDPAAQSENTTTQNQQTQTTPAPTPTPIPTTGALPQTGPDQDL